MFPIAVAPPSEVIYQDLGDEIVLLNLSDQRYFGLDDVGSDMWKLLVEHGNIEAVADRICAAYDVDRAIAREDLGILVRNLIAEGLLKPTDEPVLL